MKKTIIKRLALLLVVIIAVSAIIVAQIMPSGGPPNPQPPNAAVVECGQFVIPAAQLQWVVEAMRSQDCTHVESDYVWDGFYLVRGTKIVIDQ